LLHPSRPKDKASLWRPKKMTKLKWVPKIATPAKSVDPE
jgi:hypothetical protein